MAVAHGGDIDVAIQPSPKERPFRVTLPAQEREDDAAAMSHTVLVVEDEEDLREMMRDALELNGYAVVTAEDGQDALDKLAGSSTSAW